MSVTFSEVTIKNSNSIDVEATLEVPIGTILISTTIAGNSIKSIYVNKQDIQSAKVIVKSDSHSDYADTMAFDFINSGKPYNIFIEKIEAKTTIGSIHGFATIGF